MKKETASTAAELDNPDDIFTESLYEHKDSVTKVEKNFKDNTIFMSTGKDAQVNVWRFG